MEDDYRDHAIGVMISSLIPLTKAKEEAQEENAELKLLLGRYKKAFKEFIKQWEALESMDEDCKGCVELTLVTEDFIDILEELEKCTKS
jgi:hypothetical protein